MSAMPWYALPSRPSLGFDTDDAGHAAEVLARLVRQVGPDSLTGMVLRSARAELLSLVDAAEQEAREQPPAARAA